MKVKSAIITQASGSLGGLTATRDRGRVIFKGRSLPTDPNTARQQGVREAFGLLTNTWSNVLTPAQRESWATYASNVPRVDSLGQEIQISPMNHFIRSNSPRLIAGDSLVSDAPGVFNLGSPVTSMTAFSDGLDLLEILWTWDSSGAGNLYIYGGRPQNPSVQYFRGPYRFLGKYDVSATNTDVSYAQLGGKTGQQVFFRAAVSLDDGRLSPDAQLSCILP